MRFAFLASSGTQVIYTVLPEVVTFTVTYIFLGAFLRIKLRRLETIYNNSNNIILHLSFHIYTALISFYYFFETYIYTFINT